MQKNLGFTLIELLVVVLIIGILAAVALPQYEKAVLKSRATTLLSNLKTIREAVDIYYLANGYYPMDFTEIDVSFPGMELKESEGVANSLIVLPDGTQYFFDVDGYFSAQWSKYGLRFDFWYQSIWGVKKGCALMRAPTERLKAVGRSMGRFTQTTQYGDIFEIC